MNNLYKYPRTPHFPFSRSKTSDDKTLDTVDHFVGKHVIASLKIDGENTSMYRDYFHARSLDSRHHISRNFVKGLWGNIRYQIPDGWRICGENMYAKHSIYYTELPSFFIVFAVFDNKNVCLSWDETISFCLERGLETVPVLYQGIWDGERVKACMTGKQYFGGEQEGVVVRLADSFPYEDFHNCTGKMVRQGHVQTSDFWANQPIIPNKLKGAKDELREL